MRWRKARSKQSPTPSRGDAEVFSGAPLATRSAPHPISSTSGLQVPVDLQGDINCVSTHPVLFQLRASAASRDPLLRPLLGGGENRVAANSETAKRPAVFAAGHSQDRQSVSRDQPGTPAPLLYTLAALRESILSGRPFSSLRSGRRSDPNRVPRRDAKVFQSDQKRLSRRHTRSQSPLASTPRAPPLKLPQGGIYSSWRRSPAHGRFCVALHSYGYAAGGRNVRKRGIPDS